VYNSCKCSQIIRSIHHTNTYNVLQYNTNTYCISVMYTAYNLWTFTWIVHSELPFRLNGTDKIHTKELLKFHSMYNQFSVVIFSLLPRLLKYLGFTISDFFKNRPAVWQFSTLKKKLFTTMKLKSEEVLMPAVYISFQKKTLWGGWKYPPPSPQLW